MTVSCGRRRQNGCVGSFRFIAVFTAGASLCAFGAFLVFGAIVDKQVQAETKKVVVSDALGQRVHRLSGMVLVPTNCHELTTRAEEIDPANYLLIFKTWQNPNRVCNNEEKPRPFNLTIFAPSVGIAFQATLDDVSIPLSVIPTIE